jgi:glycosyltransferase involved in cell wall biosynthesis
MGWKLTAIFKTEPPDWLKEWGQQVGAKLLRLPEPSTSGADRVVEIARECNASIIKTYNLSMRAPLFPKLRHAGFNRIIQIQRTYQMPQRFQLIKRIYRRWGARRVHLFIAISDYMRQQTQREFLLGSKRVRMVLGGVNTQYFRPRDDKQSLRQQLFGLGSGALIITAASHIHPQKRLDMLVRAMPAIKKEIPEAHMIIAGDGPERTTLQSLIEKLGMVECVQILSGDNRVELICAASDLSVQPSAGEGLSGSAIEAMACGLPLVATPCGGLAEVPEDGVSGVLVHNQTPEGLADAIIPMLQDHDKRKRMGKAARERAEKVFDVRRTAQEIISIYKELLNS